MAGIREQLLADARRLLEAQRRKKAQLTQERAELAERAARIEDGLKTAEAMPERYARFESVLPVGPDLLCPVCFLERDTRTPIKPVEGTADTDRWVCPLGHYSAESDAI